MTDKPERLLENFKKKIDDGKVETWSYDADGDFSHTPSQWKNRAWLRPVIEDDRLHLKIRRARDETDRRR
jgi:hypothetical protein